MKQRNLIAAGLVALLTVAACGSDKENAASTPAKTTAAVSSAASSAAPAETAASSAAPSSEAPSSAAATTEAASSAPAATDKKGDVTLWLMKGSVSDELQKKTLDAFKAKYPDVNVKVQIQEWTGIQEKMTAALATDTPPDVMEIGNTYVTAHADAGALRDLTPNAAELGADNWVGTLKDAGSYDGKNYATAMYAGARAVVYNKDMFTKAGVEAPKTLDELKTVADKLMAANPAKDFSAFYLPSQDWYVAMPFVWDNGGEIAVKDGDKWKSGLADAPAVEGLKTYFDLAKKYSKAPKDADETKNNNVFAAEKTAMIFTQGWQVGGIETLNPKLKGKIGVFPMPGKNGKPAPTFLGGSNMAIAEKSKNPELALELLKEFTGDDFQKAMAESGNIPGSTKFLDVKKDDPVVNVFFEAGSNSKFTPTAVNWGAVETDKTLQNMLVSIFSESKTVEEATKVAAGKIESTLNG